MACICYPTALIFVSLLPASPISEGFATADHGVLVTTGNFTSSAVRFGQQHGIKLINGTQLEYLIRVGPNENVLIPDSKDEQTDCPVCKSAMIKRTARKGKNAGKQFWGCSKFPACRGTRNI